MKKILFLSVLFLSVPIYSQKCKYEKNEYDEFTKKEVKIVKENQLTKVGMGFGNFLRFDTRSMDGNKFINLIIYGTQAFYTAKDSEVMFLLTNGEVVTLNYTEDTVASSNYLKQVGHTQWFVRALLYVPEEKFNILKDASIAKVRWYTSNGYLEEEVKSKHKDYLAQALRCLE